MGFILDQFNFARLGVEDKDCANLLIGDVEAAFGIDGHTIWLAQLEQHFLLRGRLRAGESIHPGIFLGLWCIDL